MQKSSRTALLSQSELPPPSKHMPKLPKWPHDLTGMFFNMLTVASYAGHIGRSQVWLCTCQCGNSTTVRRNSLIHNQVRSCGCLLQKHRDRNKHKPSPNITKTLEYNSWYSMIERCHNPHYSAYPKYGGVGITVCERWRDSIYNFVEDMGLRPSKEYSIDRIDNNGNYEPGNCRWASKSEQTQNRNVTRWITYKGKTLCFSDMAKHLGVTAATMRRWFKNGSPSDEKLESLVAMAHKRKEIWHRNPRPFHRRKS